MQHQQFNNINPAIYALATDHLYHLGIDVNLACDYNFSTIKYVIYTSANTDIRTLANKFAKLYYTIHEESFSFAPIYKTERFNLYHIGPILFLAHGIGAPSLLIALNEITKLLIKNGNKNCAFIKINPALTELFGHNQMHVVTSALNSEFAAKYINIECGKEIIYCTNFNQDLSDEIFSFNKNNTNFALVKSKSISSNIALFSAITDFATKELANYKVLAPNFAVESLDFDSDCFAGFCNILHIPAIILNYTTNSKVAKNNSEELLIQYVLSGVKQ